MFSSKITTRCLTGVAVRTGPPWSGAAIAGAVPLAAANTAAPASAPHRAARRRVPGGLTLTVMPWPPLDAVMPRFRR
ncbi:hypothetical protein GCM10009753_63160 [Streptantibioticus ferralitis]